MKAREFADARALLAALRVDLVAMLAPVALPLQIDPHAKPFVAADGRRQRRRQDHDHRQARTPLPRRKPQPDARRRRYLPRRRRRAAAGLGRAQRRPRRGAGTESRTQRSVAFDALQAAKARGIEVLIADTAGRLHTQQGLMGELGKIKRVLQKLDPTAPHEVLMVIDGTTGQNALSQLRQFHAAVGVTGLVVTKLDGTAKGGVVFALAREFGIPIRYAGIGERPEDLRVFDAEAFVDALLPESLGG